MCIMNDFLNNYRKASLLQKKGNFESAKKIFEDLLKKTSKDNIKANIYYHLSQIEASTRKKVDLLEKALALNPSHRMAHILLNLLQEDYVQKRLENDSSYVIKQFFEKYPLNIQIQTISGCNAKCKMCPYHSSWQKFNPGKMSDKTFLHIIELLNSIPLGKVCLYLENEPFLDKKIIEKIRIVKENLHYKLIELSTNLSMFNERLIKELYNVLKDTPHELWISWHGIDENTYRNIMGFDFKKNIEKLKLYFSITKGELNTSINSIIGSKLNESRIESEDKVKVFFNDIIKSVGIDPKKIKLKIKTFYYHDRAGNINEKITNNKISEMIGKLKPYCARIREWLHFMYDGDVILCCMDYKKETVMGNVNEFSSLEDLLISKRFVRIQKMALGEIESNENFICKRCTSPGG